MAEKTEKPTPKKLKDARAKGEVGQSQDIPKLLILVALMEVILMLSPGGMDRFQFLIESSINNIGQPFNVALMEALSKAGWELVLFMLPVLAIAIVMRCAGGWLQFGILFAPQTLAQGLQRFNPVNQVKQMFSSRQLVNLLSNLCKAIVIALVLYLILSPRLGSLINAANTDLHTYWVVLAELLTSLTRVCVGVLLVISVADWALQKFFFIKQQRMSIEDVRKEYKDVEGDPHMRSYRKSLAREVAEESPTSSSQASPVEAADLLVVNPSHYAVALSYNPQLIPLPRITCKGHDALAREMIERAHRAGIPVIRFVWLARTLFRSEVEEYIPRETLQAVAQVYRLLREIEEATPGVLIEMPTELNSRIE
ncbi:type III secretion system export apparatus subunit SctU [Pseudomonas fluorescens]|uniref:type III secretion system export apparatus subunit SctU n=1 Tax=Pseudomonas fluorescens TaxID=294 RepID=UPI001BE9EB12|nr:type III secretion system export apparatus subunit SctU [Pseudomonas fluorescens]MBT2375458.1 type III secretion system export apparatus subunit SctU [Pseudomonas fluorescens]